VLYDCFDFIEEATVERGGGRPAAGGVAKGTRIVHPRFGRRAGDRTSPDLGAAGFSP